MEEYGLRKPAPDFIIRLVESDIRPWKVPMRVLARTLQAIQRLVDQRDDEDDQDTKLDIDSHVISQEEIFAKALRLVDVKSSSAAYAVAAPAHESAIHTIIDTGKMIAGPSAYDWNTPTLSAVKELSEIAKTLHCKIELRLPGSAKQYGDVLAKITPTTFSEISSSVFIKGDTSVFARIERVGGATEMHCGIRIASQPRKMVICHVADSDLIRKLGQYMYQNVLLSGHATWLRRSKHLKYFNVTSFEKPKIGSIRDALNRIHEAGGKAWDRIKDPDAKIAEMRGT